MPSSEISFGWEPCRTLFGEANWPDLIDEHWHELGLFHKDCPLDPDYERIIKAEEIGLFRAWAARSDGLLVGYMGWFVQPHIHYRRTLYAVEDLFLLSAPYRKGLNGYRMFSTALTALKQLGVVRCILHDKVHFASDRGTLAPFLVRLGFVCTDRLWTKIL